jgi:hypothetical protein
VRKLIPVISARKAHRRTKILVRRLRQLGVSMASRLPNYQVDLSCVLRSSLMPTVEQQQTE